jgi:hypothetical protein
MEEIELKVECPSCKGTGVYAGRGEGEGTSVVCYNCKGTGAYNYKYEYEEFQGRRKKEGVKRVYQSGYGYKIGTGVVNFQDGIGPIDMDKEGISYEDFVDGKMPDHTRGLACPLLADQGTCHKIEGFFDKCNELHGSSLVGVKITKCSNRKNKHECWKRFDKQSNNV